MRNVLPFLLLFAVAGGAYLLLGDDSLEQHDTTLEGDGLRDDATNGMTALRVDKQTAIGVWGQGSGTPTDPIDYGEVHQRILRPAFKSGRVSGAAILDALEEQVGLAMPVRFAMEGSLRDFRTASLEMEEPDGVDLPQVMDWIRQMGYTVEEKASFVLINKRGGAPKPQPEQPAPPPPAKRNVWNSAPSDSDRK